MKRDGLYDLQAFSTYTEIERSADIALTSLMTPEMRNLGQLKLQVLKNRDGVVPTEPLTLHIDFAHGYRVQELQPAHVRGDIHWLAQPCNLTGERTAVRAGQDDPGVPCPVPLGSRCATIAVSYAKLRCYLKR